MRKAKARDRFANPCVNDDAVTVPRHTRAHTHHRWLAETTGGLAETGEEDFQTSKPPVID